MRAVANGRAGDAHAREVACCGDASAVSNAPTRIRRGRRHATALYDSIRGTRAVRVVKNKMLGLADRWGARYGTIRSALPPVGSRSVVPRRNRYERGISGREDVSEGIYRYLLQGSSRTL